MPGLRTTDAARRPGARLRLADAVLVGALHGPAELLPVSSSGHTTLVPWLLGRPYGELDAELRKGVEVAVHAGTAAALLVALRGDVARALSRLDAREVALAGLSFLPPALAGYLLERPIERRLGTPGTIAAGLAAGALAMAAADRAPQRRRRDEAGPRDALLLGVAQACALMPGVSRNGATLVAARLRGFARDDADALSRQAAVPVIAGAVALKGARLRRRGLPAGTRACLAAATGTAFCSTLGSVGLIRVARARIAPMRGPHDRSLMPYALYRLALAGVVVRRLRENGPP